MRFTQLWSLPQASVYFCAYRDDVANEIYYNANIQNKSSKKHKHYKINMFTYVDIIIELLKDRLKPH